jgi:hypothetical protein
MFFGFSTPHFPKWQEDDHPCKIPPVRESSHPLAFDRHYLGNPHSDNL